MPRTGLTQEEYVAESERFAERWVNSARDWGALEDLDTWRGFLEDNVFGMDFNDLPEGTQNFLNNTWQDLNQGIADSQYEFQQFETRTGREINAFRDARTGRFTSISKVYEQLRGIMGRIRFG